MNIWAGFLPQLLWGTKTTIAIAGTSLIVGLLLGMIAAVGEQSSIRVIRRFTLMCTTLLRGVPELLIVFFVYFGGTAILTGLMGHYVEVSAFTAGVVGLSSIFAAYAAQTFRGAFAAVHKGQLEAARALGCTRRHSFWRILLPQTWRYALPGLGNLWLVLLKDSALVSLLGLTDLMSMAHIAASETHHAFTFYFTAALIYLGLTSLSQWGMGHCLRHSYRYDRVSS